MPLVESMNANPISPYGAEKYIGEVYCKLYSGIYNLETVCLRYFNVYGKRQSHEGTYASVIAKFLNLRKLGRPLTITGNGSQTRDFVHVSDVALANILAMESSMARKGEVINIGGKESISVNDIARFIGGELEYIQARIEPKNSQADITLAKKILNWEAKVDIKIGLNDLIKDYE
jgi:UDP-glucose 4-epimerase